ncbi:hypothetical protein HOF65_03205 [bacterium]|nr:hypothetical protein [bacterium]MBT4632623.1 hypothetical protein [bacterium]MBT6778991.1 hypothetical protein [bacterium]
MLSKTYTTQNRYAFSPKMCIHHSIHIYKSAFISFFEFFALFSAHFIFSSRLVGMSDIHESTFNVVNSIFSHSKYLQFSIASSIAFTFGGDFVQIAIFIFYI